MSVARILKRTESKFKILLLTFLLEILIFAGVTFSIPSDQANAVFLGYTTSRLLILSVFFLLFLLTILALILQKRVFNFLDVLMNRPWFVKYQSWVFLLVCSVLWFVIWLPASRFPELAEEVTRLRPLLLTNLLILFETLVFFRILLQWQLIKVRYSWEREHRKTITLVAILIVVFVAFFVLLVLVSSSKLTNTLMYSSGPFLGPIQVFLAVVLFVAVFLVSNQEKTGKIRKPVWIGLLVVIGLSAFLTWHFTPLSCADDRPGPYPPNYICYPQVDDSVYSIGSHYITLGRGVLNHWFTDKPFYMVFLAIGQWLFGKNIDDYLIFQIAVISVMPILIFLLARKLSGLAGGLLAAFLFITLNANNIHFYSSAGGINLKVENTEILTGFLLLLTAFFLMKYFSGKRPWHFLLLSGGMLGLASLTRLNPVFVLPVIVLYLLGLTWKKLRSFLSITGIFLLGFLIIFIPGTFSVRDESGKLFIFEKLERILDTRYQQGQASTTSPGVLTDRSSTLVSVQNDSGSVELVSYRAVSDVGATAEEYLAQGPGNPKTADTDRAGANPVNRLRNFTLTSLNNLYLSLARLPVDFSFHSVGQIINLPGGVTGQRIPIWQMQLSIENYIALAVTLLVVISGILFGFRRWRGIALFPLMIFLGYHLGNGAALTSGERYLEPVQWVILLYYSVGIFAIVRLVLKGNATPVPAYTTLEGNLPRPVLGKRFGKNTWFTLGILIFIAALLPATNLLPDQLSARTQVDLVKQIREMMKQDDAMQRINLSKFLESDKAIIVEGIAYHPRNYVSPILSYEDEIFELTVLGSKNVYVSNFNGDLPEEPFSEGSRVILLGCVIREKEFWGVDTVLLRAKAILQLDNEKNQFFIRPGAFACPAN